MLENYNGQQSVSLYNTRWCDCPQQYLGSEVRQNLWFTWRTLIAFAGDVGLVGLRLIALDGKVEGQRGWASYVVHVGRTNHGAWLGSLVVDGLHILTC